MKTTPRKKIIVLAVVVLAMFLFAFLSRDRQQKPFVGLFQSVIKPFSCFFSAAGGWTGERVSFFGSIGELKTDNEKLLEENMNLKSQLANFQDVKKENEQLRKQIDLAPRGEYDLEAAIVIGKDLSGQTEFVYIDKGSKHRIKEQMAVIVGEGTLIGKISKTFPTTSQVELLFGKNSKVNAEIVESGAKGIVRGQYGTAAVLDMIPQTFEINKGDSVITSGVGNLMPRGLLIGYTQDPVATADQLFQQASLVFPVQIQTIRVVWVVRGAK
ncbi:MAG: rod shape-determining protein MreC [Patescibacteria group bacterium]|nr:rod shape-determining protein MreC [Patescibacteria group bacterium]